MASWVARDYIVEIEDYAYMSICNTVNCQGLCTLLFFISVIFSLLHSEVSLLLSYLYFLEASFLLSVQYFTYFYIILFFSTLQVSKGLSTLDQDSMRIESGSTECAFNPHWSRPHSKIIIHQLTETPPLIPRENHVQPCMCHARRYRNGWSSASLVCFCSAVDCMSTVAYIGPTLSLEIATRRASRERELLELRILHERQHLVHSERWPVPKY